MNDLDLYKRLSKKMDPEDVRCCIEMPQEKFLAMLNIGLEAVLGYPVKRSDFSLIAEIPAKTIYGYFASKDARDYRVLSEDSRIAMIWRITTKAPLKTNHSREPHYYIVNGIKMRSVEAAKELGYSQKESFFRVISRNNIPNGDDVSHLKNHKKTFPKTYVVDGEVLSMNAAAKKLGYKNSSGVYNRLNGLPPGSDISHLKKTAKRTKSK